MDNNSINNSQKKEKLTVSDIVTRLSADAVRTQEIFDRIHLEQTARFFNDLESIGISPDDPIIRTVIPNSLHIKSQIIEANIQINQSRTLRFGLDLVLGGRIVNTFTEATYGTEKTKYDRLTVEVVAVPINNDQNRKE